MSYKAEQKELQQPDDLQKIGQQAVPWMEQHGRTVVYGVLAVGIVGFGISVVNHLSERAEQKAASSFGNALHVLEREVNATATPKAGDEPPFKSEAEKDQALVEKLTAFRREHAGKKAAANAALPLAEAMLRAGKPEEALPLVEEYLKGGDQDDAMRPAAFEARGYAFEAQKKYDEALAAFDALAHENKTDFMKGMGLYHRARILAIKGDLPGAAKQFSEIESAAPGSSAARLAKERLTLLAAQGVAVPAPPAALVDAGT